MPTDFVELGPKAASATILLAHGAGALMDAPGMTAIAEALAAQNLRVVRFEFAYMAQRRTSRFHIAVEECRKKYRQVE